MTILATTDPLGEFSHFRPALLMLLICSAMVLPTASVCAKSLYIYQAPAIVWNPDIPKLVVIIDDMGNNAAQGERAVQLPGSITYAFLPFTPAAKSLAEMAHNNGKEIMLHAPMSSLYNLRLGPGALTPAMNKQQLQFTLRQSIEAIPHARGINNHMGSELTQMKQPMDWIMEELICHDLFFVDSHTNPNSIAYATAQESNIPTIRRDVFLDHDPNPKAIAKAFQKAVKLAHRNGIAIAIGHPNSTTLDFLESALTNLDQWQIQLVSASEALKLPRGNLAAHRNKRKGKSVALPALENTVAKQVKKPPNPAH